MEFNSNWYIFYTKSRFEKKVYSLLNEMQFDVFLPLVKRKRKWSDRVKVVEIPLFPSYIFVNIESKDILKVLQTEGVSAILKFNGKHATLREKEIKFIKNVTENYSDIEVLEGLPSAGDEVLITQGVLEGMHGIIVESKNKTRFVLRIESIQKNLYVTIDRDWIEKSKQA